MNCILFLSSLHLHLFWVNFFFFLGIIMNIRRHIWRKRLMYYLIFQIKTNKRHQSGVLVRQPHQKILWSTCIWSRCCIFIILDGIWVIMKDSQYFQVPVELGELKPCIHSGSHWMWFRSRYFLLSLLGYVSILEKLIHLVVRSLVYKTAKHVGILFHLS